MVVFFQEFEEAVFQGYGHAHDNSIQILIDFFGPTVEGLLEYFVYGSLEGSRTQDGIPRFGHTLASDAEDLSFEVHDVN